MEFIQGLFEGRMIRDENNAKVLTYTDCCERMYLSLLMVELLRQFPTYNIVAKEYAGKTSRYTGYKSFRPSGTDLYNLIYFVDGDDAAMEKLKDPDAAKRIRGVVTFPTMAVNRYLTSVGNASTPIGVGGLMIRLETSLKISNTTYKDIRRIVVNFKGSDIESRKIAVTKLLFAARAKLRNSDLLPHLEELAAEKDLESLMVSDNEPTISVPDIKMSGSELVLYKYIVGTENVVMAKRFVELALDNKSVPSTAVKGYLPAIKMLDDIVKGGPTYINQLRALHQRAKKRR